MFASQVVSIIPKTKIKFKKGYQVNLAKQIRKM